MLRGHAIDVNAARRNAINRKKSDDDSLDEIHVTSWRHADVDMSANANAESDGG